MQLKIFLCHADEDKPDVVKLYQRLSDDGFQPWLDQECRTSEQPWYAEVMQAVNESHVILVCVSRKAIPSTKGNVRKTNLVKTAPSKNLRKSSDTTTDASPKPATIALQKEIQIVLDIAHTQTHTKPHMLLLKLEKGSTPDELKPLTVINLFEDGSYDNLCVMLHEYAQEIKRVATTQASDTLPAATITTIDEPPAPIDAPPAPADVQEPTDEVAVSEELPPLPPQLLKPKPVVEIHPPVEVQAWQNEIARRNETFGDPEGYWCYIAPGEYHIGGWDRNQTNASIELPACWVARFPVTVAQYSPFVEAGYGNDAERWWTPNGLQWKNNTQRILPDMWNAPGYNDPQQPVIDMTWYEATAFTHWLTELLRATLPEGLVIRLPTEAEWEAAAAYDKAMQRRPYPWGFDEPTPSRAAYKESGYTYPAPVGKHRMGVAPCGAQDMVGNVWEWTTNSNANYAKQSNHIRHDFTTNEWGVPTRGGAWWEEKPFVRCGARMFQPPDSHSVVFGFRLVLAPAAKSFDDAER